MQAIRTQQAKYKGKPPDALVVAKDVYPKLRLQSPKLFGPGCLGKSKEQGITLMDVRSMIKQYREVGEPDGRGHLQIVGKLLNDVVASLVWFLMRSCYPLH